MNFLMATSAQWNYLQRLRIVRMMIFFRVIVAPYTGQGNWQRNISTPDGYENCSVADYFIWVFQVIFAFAILTTYFALFCMSVFTYGATATVLSVLTTAILPVNVFSFCAMLICSMAIFARRYITRRAIGTFGKFRDWKNSVAPGTAFCLNYLRHNLSLIKVMFKAIGGVHTRLWLILLYQTSRIQQQIFLKDYEDVADIETT